jgi:hypothetical protein
MKILELRLKESKEKGMPPLALMSQAGEVIQKPSNDDIAAEIGFVIVPKIRACYDLVSCEQEGGSVNLQSVADLLFIACERLMYLLGYINNSNVAEVNPAKTAIRE